MPPPISSVQPRVTVLPAADATDVVTPVSGLRATSAAAPVDACSAEALRPEPHTASRVLSHVFKPLPLWAATAGCIVGAVLFAALPGMGILIAIFALLAALCAGGAIWRHVDIEHEHDQSQRIEALERQQRCTTQRLDELRPTPTPSPIASADRPSLTSPLNALARPA